MKMVKDDPDLPANMAPPVDACLYHRCPKHQEVRALNTEEGGAECGACVGEEVAYLEHHLLAQLDNFASRLIDGTIRKRHLQMCIDRLNFITPGAGDGMLKELAEDYQHFIIRRRTIDAKYATEGANRGSTGPAVDHSRPRSGEGGGETVRGEQEADPQRGSEDDEH